MTTQYETPIQLSLQKRTPQIFSWQLKIMKGAKCTPPQKIFHNVWVLSLVQLGVVGTTSPFMPLQFSPCKGWNAGQGVLCKSKGHGEVQKLQ